MARRLSRERPGVRMFAGSPPILRGDSTQLKSGRSRHPADADSWEPRSPPTRAGLGGESTLAALLPQEGAFLWAVVNGSKLLISTMQPIRLTTETSVNRFLFITFY